MPVRVDVWSDFVCPYCFAASCSLQELQQTHAIELHWRSYELRPAGAPPIAPWYLKRIEESRPRVHQMMRETYGVEINEGRFGITSRKALIGAKYAESVLPDGGLAYHDAVLRAYWMEARDISEVAVLREVAVTLGMDADSFAAALDDETYDEQVSTDVLDAQIKGLSGVPALIFGGKFLLSGAQPVEVLRHVVDRIEADGGDSLARA
ncbi:MAG: DsbA family protein [Chloroflexota bacterium]|nr:DsbA family protein [Chloroflexota bacterium]